MNSYTISVDMDEATLKIWLIKNQCPKAAASVKQGKDYKSQFVMLGNVSTLSTLNVFKTIGASFKAVPIGNSEPLPKNSMMIGENLIEFA